MVDSSRPDRRFRGRGGGGRSRRPQVAKELGASERVERIVRQTTHTVVSTGVQWTVNAGMADPVGAAAAPAAAIAGAQAHQIALDLLASGQVPAPIPSS